ncbi:MAG: ABC transporter permease [Deltaproteobacteria bacterium]|nr:ABC transporter permease [Deltaproteobacteria bacterium]
MRPGLLPYFFRQAGANVRNNPMVHGIGLVTMVISFLIFGSFLLLFVNVNVLIDRWGHSLSMSVYLEDGVSQSQTENIRARIEGLPGAEVRSYISKEKALADFRAALGPRAGLLDGLSSNPLPASMEVVFGEEAGHLEPAEVKVALEALEGVEEVQYSREWVRRFEGAMRMVQMVGFIIGGLLCLGVLFIVTNTIKMTIYGRKEEIEILQLVGATGWFVKTPFLLEGVIQGALSGIVSIGGLYLAYLVLSWKRFYILGAAAIDFIFIPPSYAFSLFLISVFFGLLGSFIAVGQFFDV